MPLVDQDQEHLKILSIAWYVMAGMIAFFALFGLLYVVLGIFLSISPPPSKAGDDSARFVGPLFAIIGGLFTLLGGAVAVCTFLSGRYIAGRQHRTFCFVMAGLSCFSVPFGTALGVFTFLVLQRPSVKQMFEGADGSALNLAHYRADPPPLPQSWLY